MSGSDERSVSMDEYACQLLDLQVPSQLDLANDGSQLVYAAVLDFWGMQRKGEQLVNSIWLAKTGKVGSARPLTSGLFHDQHPAFDPTGNTVAFLSDRAKQGQSSAIYCIALAGGEAYPVTPTELDRSIETFKWSPDSKSIAFLVPDETTHEKKAKDEAKDDAEVWGVDCAKNRLKLVHLESRDIMTIVSIDEHISDFDWDPDGESIVFVTRPQSNLESQFLHASNIYITSRKGTDLAKLLSFPSPVRGIIHTGDSIHFIGPYAEAFHVSANAIYRMDLGGEPEAAYARIAHGDVDCATDLRKLGRNAACHVQRGTEDRLVMLSGTSLLKFPNEISSWDAAYATDGDDIVIALVKSGTGMPAEVYTSNAPDGDLVKLSNHGASLKDKGTASCTFVSCQTSDGTVTIEGVFLTPGEYKSGQGTPTKPLATVVFIHGGPYTRITDKFNPSYFYLSNVYLSAGYAVLFPNYRGSSGRGDAFASTARGGCGIVDQSDIIAMTQHCIEQGFTDKDRIVVGGWSQGGYLSYLCAVRNGMHDFGWRFKGAMPGAGVTDWDTMCLTSDVAYAEAMYAGAGPWAVDKHDTRNRKGSAIWELKHAVEAELLPPLLIVHGQKDARVPIEQARGFRRGLEHYGLFCEYVEYPREEHIISERKHLEDLIRRSLRLIERHLSKP